MDFESYRTDLYQIGTQTGHNNEARGSGAAAGI